jgi:excinuclease ABC subunit C
VKRFDRKFGATLWRELPDAPGVYLFKDGAGTVLYVGKAVSLRRRLQGYRNAGRRKAQRKMRALVREASALEIRPLESEREALLAENELIRTLRPRYNVDGAFFFLYPAVGIWRRGAHTVLILTTRQPEWAGIAADWYGTFRSRARTKQAFEACAHLLGFLGHAEPRANLSGLPRVRGARVVALRRLDAAAVDLLRTYWSGASRATLGALAELLVERPGAREKAAEIEESLRILAAFHADDIQKLRATLLATRGEVCFVSQQERDRLFIEHRSEGPSPG